MAALSTDGKVALEVRTPDGVRSVIAAEPLAVWVTSTHSTPLTNESLSAKDFSYRAGHRQYQVRVSSTEQGKQFPRAPTRMPLPRLHQQFDDRIAHGMRMAMRSTGSIYERLDAALVVPLSPLIALLTADAEPRTQLDEAILGLQIGRDEFHSLVHRGCLFPWH